MRANGGRLRALGFQVTCEPRFQRYDLHLVSPNGWKRSIAVLTSSISSLVYTSTAAVTKHIFVGQTRIASKLHYTDQSPGTRALYMTQNTFWYHPDHLGSTNWMTDAQGEGYEHFTYTPYGEAWVEEHLSSRIHRMSHRFTGQELDPETGLYAFPARNYDPRTSRWLSADPALAEYLPIAPTSDEAREHNQNLGGEGGIFNPVNMQVYHYTFNNPIIYVDPDGRQGHNRDLAGSTITTFEDFTGKHISEVFPNLLIPEDANFTGAITDGTYAQGSAVVTLAGESGMAYVFEDGYVTENFIYDSTTFGFETNVSFEVGKSITIIPGATGDDVVGGSTSPISASGGRRIGPIVGLTGGVSVENVDSIDSAFSAYNFTAGGGVSLLPGAFSGYRSNTTRRPPYRSLRERRPWLNN